MQTCKRCGESVPKHSIQSGDVYFHIDCFYMTQGESYGKEALENQPPPQKAKKSGWWVRVWEYLNGNSDSSR